LEFVATHLPVTVEQGQHQGEGHEDSAQPNGALGEDIGSLSAEDGIGEVSAKRGSQPLGAGFLHENQQGQKDANEDIDPQKNVDGEINHFRMPERVGQLR